VDDAELMDNDIIVRYRGERVIGITVPYFLGRDGQKDIDFNPTNVNPLT